jgi:LytS/YehU family sensor histidine kinase
MLELLSDVLRQVLRTDRAHEVTLAEELHFLRQYLAIEEVRFSDRLRVTIAVDDALLDAAVPPFILQPLVENALRHGLARRSDAGSIVIGAARRDADLVLSVRDDGPGPQPADEGSTPGVGLANTRERLQTLYGDRAGVAHAATGQGAVATITLPFRRLVPARADA